MTDISQTSFMLIKCFSVVLTLYNMNALCKWSKAPETVLFVRHDWNFGQNDWKQILIFGRIKIFIWKNQLQHWIDRSICHQNRITNHCYVILLTIIQVWHLYGFNELLISPLKSRWHDLELKINTTTCVYILCLQIDSNL